MYDLSQLGKKCVLVAGAGGLGGYVVELLARAGVGRLIVADGDRFSDSNMNRQLLATYGTLGLNKAEVAEIRVANISKTEVAPIQRNLTELTIRPLMSGVDLIIDAVDNVETRLLLQKVATEYKIPLVHGAVTDVCGEVAVVEPDSDILSRLYKNGAAAVAPTAGFVVSAVAALQVNEAIRLLSGEKSSLDGQVLVVDLQTLDFKKVIV